MNTYWLSHRYGGTRLHFQIYIYLSVFSGKTFMSRTCDFERKTFIIEVHYNCVPGCLVLGQNLRQ